MFHQVPEIEWELTTERVLTMEYCDGVHIDDVEAVHAQGVDPQFVSECVGKVSANYLRLIYPPKNLECTG